MKTERPVLTAPALASLPLGATKKLGGMEHSEAQKQRKEKEGEKKLQFLFDQQGVDRECEVGRGGGIAASEADGAPPLGERIAACQTEILRLP